MSRGKRKVVRWEPSYDNFLALARKAQEWARIERVLEADYEKNKTAAILKKERAITKYEQDIQKLREETGLDIPHEPTKIQKWCGNQIQLLHYGYIKEFDIPNN